MAFVLTTDATQEPLTVQQAKEHLRVDHNDDDALIGALITAARQECEEIAKRAFMSQTWTLYLDAFPSQCAPRSLEAYMAKQSHSTIKIPRPQLLSVDSIKYIDINGVQQTLDPSLYQVDNKTLGGRIRPAYNKTWPSTRDVLNAVEVQVKIGYGSYPYNVPEKIKNACKLLIGTYYQNREAIQGGADPKALPKPALVEWILSPYKVVSV